MVDSKQPILENFRASFQSNVLLSDPNKPCPFAIDRLSDWVAAKSGSKKFDLKAGKIDGPARRHSMSGKDYNPLPEIRPTDQTNGPQIDCPILCIFLVV
jgi:hypothetical protein